MKFHCKDCKSLFVPEDDVNLSINTDGKYLVECPVCTDFYDGECEPVYMEPVPYYETPEQYEKRTGKAYPDERALWCWVDGYEPYWRLFNSLKRVKESRLCVIEESVVIADPPVPPPDDWKPKEEVS